MASSSSKRRRSYDVFLSFRGPDVRSNFVGHLYTALDQAGINTYIDSEELEKGKKITTALMEAIEESQIAIVIFSENYASSVWCLDEFTEIMERKKQNELSVWPVFYKVEPREVRTPREIYKEAMAMHEVTFEKDLEKLQKVQRWKEALFDAGNLFGWHYFANGCEAGLIQQIVQKISTQLNRMPLDVAIYPVGIDSRVQELKKILNLESKDDVLRVGLWGQGGVGKTTLAKAIYNTVFTEFHGSSFLERVRENSKNSNDLVSLQEKLLSEVLLGKKLPIFSVDGGSQLIQERLCNKKVLIILDDVDDKRQLNALARNCDWVAKGSRIIITTRDKHLLDVYGVDHIYEVKALEDGEALKLFKKHAFRRNQNIEIRSNLVDSVLHYAKGLPLALEVLGSFLCGRGEQEWKSTLQKLTKTTNPEINDVLKVSYDGLDDYTKEVFLDIACFFKGERTEYIKKVLDSCDFDTTIEVRILIDCCLISEEEGFLQMHDLIQLMGMDIVKKESRDDPGQRNRLWLYDDVSDVLSRDVGTTATKAIVLKLPKPEEMYICANAFTNMRKLRLLILHNVDNSFQGPIHLPNQLRWFEWPCCAAIPEFSNGQKKLVGLDLQNSNIKVVPKQFKDFKILKFIDLSKCQLLVCMPDLECTPNLEELDLHGCTNLEHLPDVLRSKKLQRLNLNDCSKLQIFPDIPDTVKCLQELYLGRTSIEELPPSIKNLVSLEKMELKDCKKLASFPSSIYKLPNLTKLMLSGCSKLIKFPKMEEDCNDPHTKIGFPRLEELDLSGCNLSEVEFLENHSCFPSLYSLMLSRNNFANLPTCEQLYNLLNLDVSFCRQLQEILKMPRQLQALNAYGCESLSKISSDIRVVDSISFELCHELVRNGLTTNDLFKLEHFHPETGNRNILLPGGEMPGWLVPNKEGYISFMASKDLYDKVLRLAFCVVLRGKDVKEEAIFEFAPWVNNRLMRKRLLCLKLDEHHVWLQCCEPRELWGEHTFDPNDPSHFQFSIRALKGAIIEKCGFRLICKPLENDMEVLLQHNQLLDQALIYKVWHEESRNNTVEESSSETEDLQDSKTNTEEESSSKLLHKGSNMVDFSIEKYRYSRISREYQNVRLGEEMPEEFVLVEDGTISFRASQDLYDKFLGLVLCVVLGVEDGKKEISFDIVPHVNGQRRNVLSGTLSSFNLSHMWIQYLRPNVLWGMLEGGVDFGQFNERYLQFSLTLRVSGATMKKLGYVLRCRQLEDDLKIVLEDSQLVVPAALCEDSDSEEDVFPDWVSLSREYLRKCHMHIEESEASDNERN